MTSKEARQDVMKFWPVIALMVTLATGSAVPAILFAGNASARLTEVEKKADKISDIAEDIAAIKALLRQDAARRRP